MYAHRGTTKHHNDWATEFRVAARCVALTVEASGGDGDDVQYLDPCIGAFAPFLRSMPEGRRRGIELNPVFVRKALEVGGDATIDTADFLTWERPAGDTGRLIVVANPPYGSGGAGGRGSNALSLKFLHHALQLRGIAMVGMLLGDNMRRLTTILRSEGVVGHIVAEHMLNKADATFVSMDDAGVAGKHKHVPTTLQIWRPFAEDEAPSAPRTPFVDHKTLALSPADPQSFRIRTDVLHSEDPSAINVLVRKMGSDRTVGQTAFGRKRNPAEFEARLAKLRLKRRGTPDDVVVQAQDETALLALLETRRDAFYEFTHRTMPGNNPQVTYGEFATIVLFGLDDPSHLLRRSWPVSEPDAGGGASGATKRHRDVDDEAGMIASTSRRRRFGGVYLEVHTS